MRVVHLIAILTAAFATGCAPDRHDYEVLPQGGDSSSDTRSADDAVGPRIDARSDDGADVTTDGPLDVALADVPGGTCGLGDASACPTAPHASVTCESSQCIARCDVGFADCNMLPGDGCEVHTASDPANCDACGNVCTGATNASPRCAGGACLLACVSTFANCDGLSSNGCEVNLQVNPSGCGTCGTVCTGAPNALPACAAGVCNIRCEGGFLDCDGNTANGCETHAPSC